MSPSRLLNKCRQEHSASQSCSRCGLLSADGVKTQRYATPFHFNAKHYLSSLRKTSSAVLASPEEYSEEAFLLLGVICDKFTFTEETLALGIYLYQRWRQANPKENDPKFWSSVCLIVAGKAIELDKNVPYLNRYQRYADKGFTQQEYEEAERSIFESLAFEVQFSTFVTFIDFYMMSGVVFASDSISDNLVEFIEDDIRAKAKQFIKKGVFMKYKPEMLALAIIRQTRQKYKMTPWCLQLQRVSGYAEEDLELVNTSSSGVLRELNCLGSNNQFEKGQKGQRVMELRNFGILPRKKYEYPPLRNHDSNRGMTEKYSSISKQPTTGISGSYLKENSYASSSTSASKFLAQSDKIGLHVRSKQQLVERALLGGEGYAGSDLLKKR